MQVEIPQSLADAIRSRIAGVSIEDNGVRIVQEAIDEEKRKKFRLRPDSPLREMALKTKADVRAGRTIPFRRN